MNICALTFPTEFKDWVGILQSGFTITAMIVGGIWTYLKFIKQREHFPRLNLSMTFDCLPVNETHNLIHVAVLHENKGEVLMEGKTAEMRLRLVAPLHPEIGQDVEKLRQQVEETSNCIVWPALEVRLWEFSEWNPFEIEPDEQDTLHADFLVEKTVKSIQIYYYIHNIEKRKKNLGWALSQYFQVPVNEKQTPHPMNRLSDPRPKNERPDRERPDQQKQQRQQAPQPVQPVARPVRPVQPREPIQAPEKKK